LARFVRIAVVVSYAVLVLATAALAGDRSQIVSTHCQEIEVPLDATHSSARLAGCGDESAANLLWHLDRIGHSTGQLEGMFERTSRGAGTVVYVMDTGIRADHVEFTGDGGSRVIAGYDVAQSVPIGASNCQSGNKALAPCYGDFTELTSAGHGTSVASLIAGHTVGVAPEARIVSIRVMNESGLATTRTYRDGLDAIVAHAWSPSSPPFHTAIVNISGWVLERVLPAASDPAPAIPFSVIEQKIRDMIHGVDAHGRPDSNGKRFLFVVAGNNIDTDHPGRGGCGRDGRIDRFPATLGPRLEGLITVGGMTADNRAWPGACRGGLEILAPGQSIFSATITASDHYRGRKPNLRSGTSFSTPIISGIAALLLGEHPSLTPEQLESMIEKTPSRIGNPTAEYADGRVGIIAILPPAMTSAAATGSVTVPWRSLESDR
jgi:subtilisin family serine protease